MTAEITMEALATAENDLPKFTADDIEGEQCPRCLQNLGKQIAAHLERARKAEEKAEQHYIAILQLLEKAKQDCDAGGFAAFQQKFCPDLGRSRVFELKAIATGKKTLEDTRAATRERVARHRARQVESVTVTDSSPTADSSPPPTMPATDADKLAAQRMTYYAGTDEPDQNVVHAGEVNRLDQAIRAGEAAAAEYTRSVEASTISREQILAEFFASASITDILAHIPAAKHDQICKQAVDDFLAGISFADAIPRARRIELFDLCIRAYAATDTPITPTKTDKKLLEDLNGMLRSTLDQEDAGSAGRGVKLIREKLACNKRNANELRLVFVKKGRATR